MSDPKYLHGVKPGDRRVRVDRPYARYFRYSAPGIYTARLAAHEPTTGFGRATARVRHVLFGNIDPSGILARGSVTEVREKTREMISVWKPGAHFVLNAGCAIPPTAPPENIRTMIETAHQEGVYF